MTVAVSSIALRSERLRLDEGAEQAQRLEVEAREPDTGCAAATWT